VATILFAPNDVAPVPPLEVGTVFKVKLLEPAVEVTSPENAGSRAADKVPVVKADASVVAVPPEGQVVIQLAPIQNPVALTCPFTSKA
jgi:hypothetical protein